MLLLAIIIFCLVLLVVFAPEKQDRELMIYYRTEYKDQYIPHHFD